VRLKHWIKHPPEVNENTVKYTMDASEMAAVDANKQRYQVGFDHVVPHLFEKRRAFLTNASAALRRRT
jgi:hypothetical protein